MKFYPAFLILLSLALFPLTALAQIDERNPGIYAVVDGTSTPLAFQFSVGSGRPYYGKYNGEDASVLEPGIGGFRYKGVCSGVLATDTLVLVVDLEKESGSAAPGKFDYFVKDMTPDSMVILPLKTNVNKQRREFEDGIIIKAFCNGNESGGVPFGWSRISDNSFRINMPDLAPREYGVFFRTDNLYTFLLHYLFGFTVQ